MITIRAYFLLRMMSIAGLALTNSCMNSHQVEIESVKINFPGENITNAHLEVNTATTTNAHVKYWMEGREENPFGTQISKLNNHHNFLLTELKPGQNYVYNIVSESGRNSNVSPEYYFRTIDWAPGIQDTFKVICNEPSAIPSVFESGFIMIYRREDPGLLILLDSKGNIVWFHQLKNAGFKVVRFTKNQTFLCLLGTRDYQTGYGNAILELTLTGDTLLYLRKGENDFTQTIHHEIIQNPADQIVTICSEKKVFDLRSRGGLANDTVNGDGILVLDRQGRKIWKWTVFDELDPLADKSILKTKKDWMHANSISFDKDGNYLVSFYNNGQIWKIDAITGRVIWKFGKNGDFEIPAGAVFGEAHAVHVNDRGWLMFFDNGTNNKLSRSLAFSLNEVGKKAELVFNTWLPPQLFSDRMGSSYLVGDNALLHCISKHRIVALTNFKGEFLWQLKTNRLMSYRAEFIPKERLGSHSLNH